MKKTILLSLFFLISSLGLMAQGVVRNRPGTQGQNDFWVRSVVEKSLSNMAYGDTIKITTDPIPCLGTVYSLVNDTTHRMVWHVENMSNDSIKVYVKPYSCSANGLPYTGSQDYAIGGYAPTYSQIKSGKYLGASAILYLRMQYVRFEIYVVRYNTESISRLGAGSKLRFYLIGL